jgi:hypothetical protein
LHPYDLVLGNYLHDRQAHMRTEYGGANNVAIIQVVARFAAQPTGATFRGSNKGDFQKHPTHRVEVTLRGSTGTEAVFVVYVLSTANISVIAVLPTVR